MSTKATIFSILEKTPNSGHFFLLDLDKSIAIEFSDREKLPDLFKNHFIVLIDAKSFLQKYQIDTDPNYKIICLSTIKKLIGKSIHEPVHIKEFSTKEDALNGLIKVVKEAFNCISKLKIKDLTALECQVILATIAMENRGIPFNKELWQKTLSQFKEESKKIKEKLEVLLVKSDGFLLFGPEPVDLNNPKDVKTALEKVLKQKISGTSQSNLKDVDHEAVKLLLQYRENARMLSVYGEEFLSRIENNRLKGNFIPIGSASGRFACHEPNLLALPNHLRFQACLIPEAPYRLIHFDYGAFELRILAALSLDPAMLAIFNDNRDIHSMVAEAVFNTKVSKSENSHLRDQAKLLNFGIIYGMKESALSKQLKIGVTEANHLLQSYFKRFLKVREFLESLEREAKNNGYVSTALGRRAYFIKDHARDHGHLERVARNVPIQGTGADIIKLAMCKVFKRLRSLLLDAHMVNVVHDEIVIECHNEIIDEVCALVKTEMAYAFNAILPDVLPDISIKNG